MFDIVDADHGKLMIALRVCPFRACSVTLSVEFDSMVHYTEAPLDRAMTETHRHGLQTMA